MIGFLVLVGHGRRPNRSRHNWRSSWLINSNSNSHWRRPWSPTPARKRRGFSAMKSSIRTPMTNTAGESTSGASMGPLGWKFPWMWSVQNAQSTWGAANRYNGESGA